MNDWPPKLGPGTVHHYTVKARVLRAEAFNAAFRRLFKIPMSAAYTVARASAVSKSGYRFCVRPRSLFSSSTQSGRQTGSHSA